MSLLRTFAPIAALLLLGCSTALNPSDARIGLWSLGSDLGTTWFGIRHYENQWVVQTTPNASGSFDGTNLSLSMPQVSLFKNGSIATYSNAVFAGKYGQQQDSQYPFNGTYQAVDASGSLATGSWHASFSDW